MQADVVAGAELAPEEVIRAQDAWHEPGSGVGRAWRADHAARHRRVERGPQRSARQVAGGPGGAAGPGRGTVWPGGAAPAAQGVRAGAAGRPAKKELLDDR